MLAKMPPSLSCKFNKLSKQTVNQLNKSFEHENTRWAMKVTGSVHLRCRYNKLRKDTRGDDTSAKSGRSSDSRRLSNLTSAKG